MSESIVWVVQNQHRFDRDAGVFVPKHDLTPAADFGRLEFLLSPTAAPFNFEPLAKELREKLSDFRDQDYLLLIGNPALIAATASIAAAFNNGRAKVLQWSGKDQRYISIQLSNLSR